MALSPILWRIIEYLLAGFAAWTAAYHLVFFSRLPSILAVIPFAVFLAAAVLGLRRRRGMGEKNEREPTGNRWAAGLGGLCLLSGLGLMLVSRPDPDDLDFFHRALVQAARPLEPYTIHDTIHDLPDLPPLSLPHYLTSYEPLAALAGKATGIGPLRFYHNITVFIVGALLPALYLLLYRELGVENRGALLAAAGAMLFLLIDGNPHRSFGNFSLIRCWQGKCSLAALLVPLTLLASYRYLRNPSSGAFLTVFLCGVSAVGLSSSGIFMLPLFLLAISPAFLSADGFSRANLARAAKLNLAGLYPLAFAALLALNLIPADADTFIWCDPAVWPEDWWANLRLVLGERPAVVRDLFILLCLPAAALRRQPALFLVALTLFFVALFANPLAGPFWIRELLPGGYWRLAFLLPLPLTAGLFFECFRRRGRSGRAVIVRYGTALALVVLAIVAFRGSVLARRTHLKSPLALRFSPPQMALIRSLEEPPSGRLLLAPPPAAAAAALFDPSIRLEISRPKITRHIFRIAGWPEEGERRAAAQQLVWRGIMTAETIGAFRASIARGVNAVVTLKEHLPAVRDLLAEEAGTWVTAGERGYYVLFLESRESAEGGER